MKISDRFSLGVSQYSLDFVDIDTSVDTPLFVDPYYLSQRQDRFSIDASRCIKSFFSTFLALARAGNVKDAFALFLNLNEPNETCLGMSRGEPKGAGIGVGNAADICASLLQSTAMHTGLIQDLEDCRIFVDGIDKDKTSDMATNIIRKTLIDYTQAQCVLWKIPLNANVPSGLYWDPQLRQWTSSYEKMLLVDGRKILLVPKAVVSFSKRYTASTYYNHFILNYLQNEHLRMNTALVQTTVRRGKVVSRRVTKKSLKEGGYAPTGKQFIVTFTQAHPEVFEKFKKSHRAVDANVDQAEISGDDIAAVAKHISNELSKIKSGGADASRYHRLIVCALELLFYPHLICPQVEQEIHQGRKRIDIMFDNAATEGFFHRVHDKYQLAAQFVPVECKNYSRDVANPELDQISGRFGVQRGKVGLVVCRSINDMDRFIDRCADTLKDGRGLVIPLVDKDIHGMLEKVENGEQNPSERFLADRYRAIATK